MVELGRAHLVLAQLAKPRRSLYQRTGRRVLGPGRLDVFVSGQDESLYTNWYTDGEWHSWGQLAGYYMESSPAAVSWGPGRLDVFYAGQRRWSDDPGKLATNWYDGEWNFGLLASSWGRYYSYAVASWGPRRLDVFAHRNEGDALYTFWYDGEWHWPPGSLGTAVGTEFVGTPAAVSWGPRRLDVFIPDNSGQLNWKTYQ